MNKHTNVEQMPKRRFSEFETDNWKQESFGDLASLVTDYVANGSFQSLRENVNVTDEESAAYYVRLVDLRAGLGHKEQKYIDQSSYQFLKKSALKSGDLLMANIGANVGEVWQMPKVDKPSSLAPNMIMARFNDETCDAYIYYFLDSKFGQSEISKSIGGGAHPKINKTDLKQVRIILPENKQEQQKISDCLSSIDCAIESQMDKLDALNSYKAGLMQRLFPNNGKTIPEIRFPEFKGNQAWIKKPFSSLFKLGSGKDYKHLNKGDIPVYGSGGYMLSVDKYLYDGESACIGRKGTINNPLFLKGKFWTVDTLFYTHSFKNCLPKFIFALFQNINWLKYNEAGGVPSLSKVIINKIEVLIPQDINEQKRIIEFLDSVDRLVRLQEKRVSELIRQRSGLMQQLLPYRGAS